LAGPLNAIAASTMAAKTPRNINPIVSWILIDPPSA
jgi:hypothetical protein